MISMLIGKYKVFVCLCVFALDHYGPYTYASTYRSVFVFELCVCALDCEFTSVCICIRTCFGIHKVRECVQDFTTCWSLWLQTSDFGFLLLKMFCLLC